PLVSEAIDLCVLVHEFCTVGEPQPHCGHLSEQRPVFWGTDQLSEPEAISSVTLVLCGFGHLDSPRSTTKRPQSSSVPKPVNNSRGCETELSSSGFSEFLDQLCRRGRRCATPRPTGDMQRSAAAWRRRCRQRTGTCCSRSLKLGVT